jgi:O-antigen/teichoic acid export membrane protein
LIAAVKRLFKDSVVYGIANIIQKVTPLVIIPIIIKQLGDVAFRIYDLSFVYAYLFSSLIVLGQDSAASVFYFEKEDKVHKRQVLSYSFLIQVCTVLGYLVFFYPFRFEVARLVFGEDATQAKYWIIAISIIPGYFMYNYGLNILLINRRKGLYVFFCFLQALLTIGGAYTAIVLLEGTISHLFLVLIGSMSVCGVSLIILLRKEIFEKLFPVNFDLLQKLFIFGFPFALTSFFRQVIPSVDRFFLLKYNYALELPQYILAVKLGSFINIAFASFALAFTPYSLSKIHDKDAEQEISHIFHLVSILALTFIPIVLIFKDWMILFFADPGYGLAGSLLPIFLFGWVFDLFTNFALLGIYRSKKSFFILTLLVTGTILISILNVFLVPLYGVFGAAISFGITKLASFIVAVIYLRKHFKLNIDLGRSAAVLFLSLLCCYLNYTMSGYLYLFILFLVVSGISYYVYKFLRRHQLEGYFSIK